MPRFLLFFVFFGGNSAPRRGSVWQSADEIARVDPILSTPLTSKFSAVIETAERGGAPPLVDAELKLTERRQEGPKSDGGFTDADYLGRMKTRRQAFNQYFIGC